MKGFKDIQMGTVYSQLHSLITAIDTEISLDLILEFTYN